jgi:hypothetical protein
VDTGERALTTGETAVRSSRVSPSVDAVPQARVGEGQWRYQWRWPEKGPARGRDGQRGPQSITFLHSQVLFCRTRSHRLGGEGTRHEGQQLGRSLGGDDARRAVRGRLRLEHRIFPVSRDDRRHFGMIEPAAHYEM